MNVIGIPADWECCTNCIHFRQHYVADNLGRVIETATPVPFGHCSHPRVKIRKPTDSCPNFTRKEDGKS